MREYNNSTVIGSSQAVATGTGPINTLSGVIITSGTATAQVEVYDGTSSSGTKILWLNSIANNSVIATDLDIGWSSGLYVDISGSVDAVTIMWR